MKGTKKLMIIALLGVLFSDNILGMDKGAEQSRKKPKLERRARITDESEVAGGNDEVAQPSWASRFIAAYKEKVDAIPGDLTNVHELDSIVTFLLNEVEENCKNPEDELFNHYQRTLYLFLKPIIESVIGWPNIYISIVRDSTMSDDEREKVHRLRVDLNLLSVSEYITIRVDESLTYVDFLRKVIKNFCPIEAVSLQKGVAVLKKFASDASRLVATKSNEKVELRALTKREKRGRQRGAKLREAKLNLSIAEIVRKYSHQKAIAAQSPSNLAECDELLSLINQLFNEIKAACTFSTDDDFHLKQATIYSFLIPLLEVKIISSVANADDLATIALVKQGCMLEAGEKLIPLPVDLSLRFVARFEQLVRRARVALNEDEASQDKDSASKRKR